MVSAAPALMLLVDDYPDNLDIYSAVPHLLGTKPCLPERLLDEIRAIVPAARSRSGDPTP
jgi:hypothetical protein